MKTQTAKSDKITHTRGFVTIATGAERYYKLAENLRYSYKLFAAEPLPFAIIADRENKYTSSFDDVIIIDRPTGSYMDKLCLYELLPYDETIFIDADCLAYGDLNCWFSWFSSMNDFSCFGYAFTDLSTPHGWFDASAVPEPYAEKIKFVPSFNGGVYYLRRSAICGEVFALAKKFAAEYDRRVFRGFLNPADEPLLGLAMAIQDCWPVNRPAILFAPKSKHLSIDPFTPKVCYKQESIEYSIIHWSNYLTQKSRYRFETERLRNRSSRHTLKYWLLYRTKLRLLLLYPYNLLALWTRIKKGYRKADSPGSFLKKGWAYLHRKR